MTHSCELENFSGEIFEDGGNVDGGLGSHAHLVLGVVLQETLDTTAGKLENEQSATIADCSLREKKRFANETQELKVCGGV